MLSITSQGNASQNHKESPSPVRMAVNETTSVGQGVGERAPWWAVKWPQPGELKGLSFWGSNPAVSYAHTPEGAVQSVKRKTRGCGRRVDQGVQLIPHGSQALRAAWRYGRSHLPAGTLPETPQWTPETTDGPKPPLVLWFFLYIHTSYVLPGTYPNGPHRPFCTLGPLLSTRRVTRKHRDTRTDLMTETAKCLMGSRGGRGDERMCCAHAGRRDDSRPGRDVANGSRSPCYSEWHA